MGVSPSTVSWLGPITCGGVIITRRRTVDGSVLSEETLASARRVCGEIDDDSTSTTDDIWWHSGPAVTTNQLRGIDQFAVVNRHRVELASRVSFQVKLLKPASSERRGP